MICKREGCKKKVHMLEMGYCSSICNIKGLEEENKELKAELNLTYAKLAMVSRGLS